MSIFIDIGGTWTRVGRLNDGKIELVDKFKTSELDLSLYKDIKGICGAGRLFNGRLYLPNLKREIELPKGIFFINDNEAYAYGVASLRNLDISKVNLFVKIGTGVGVSVSVPYKKFVVLSTEAGHSTSLVDTGLEWEDFLGGRSLKQIMEKFSIEDDVTNFFSYESCRGFYLKLFKLFLSELVTYYNVTGEIYLGGSVIVNNKKWFQDLRLRFPKEFSGFYHLNVEVVDNDLLNLEGLRVFLKLN